MSTFSARAAASFGFGHEKVWSPSWRTGAAHPATMTLTFVVSTPRRHLFLRDAKYHVPLARIVQSTIANDGNRFEEPSIENILKNCPVKIGGGKSKVMLHDLMPNIVVQDFMKICERYADDL